MKDIKRGIVIPHANVTIKPNYHSTHESYNHDEMLYLSLYWDEIVMPAGMIRPLIPYEKELIANAILSRPESSTITPSSFSIDGEGKVNYMKHELHAFAEIAKSKLYSGMEDWTIQHYSDNPIYLPEHRNEQNMLRLRVTNLLPFPAFNEHLKIDDLIKFKFERKDELGCLHASMDELVKRMYEEPIPALRESELKRFENAIKELDKPLIERFKFIKKSDWELNLNLDPVNLVERGSAICAALVADHAVNKFPIFTSIAALSSVLTLGKTYGFTLNRYARDDLKLEYISKAKSAKIVP